jgi:alcohol dehydrogenase class IV
LNVVKVNDPDADRMTIEFFQKFLTDIGLNTRLRDHGVKPDHFDALIAQAIDDPCHKTNAVLVAKDDFRMLYQEAF